MKKNGKKLTKIIAPVAFGSGCLATIPTTSCSNNMYHYERKITDYLHEITYDDYRYDSNYETIDKTEAFGCSSVRCGDYYGRNFDYVYNDTPEFIVRVKANKAKKRHESIGVATHFGLREAKLVAGKYNHQLELIPNLTMDGINDAGVICSSNVVSMEPNQEKDEQGQNVTPETNPDCSYKLHALFVPRYVLDNADSAEDAVQKLTNNVNVFGCLNQDDPDNQMNLHIMIADKNKTYVVEFFRNKDSIHNHFDVIAEEKSDSFENPTSIMTNHYLNMDQAKFENHDKFGNERYQILKKYYPQSQEEMDSFNSEKMVQLLKHVQFSRAYEKSSATEDRRIPYNKVTGEYLETCDWYSEKLKQKFIDTYDYTKEPDQQSADWISFYSKMDQLKTDYENKVREEADPSFWQTTHNSTYHWDWQKNEGILSVIVQEQYDAQYEYKIQFTNKL